MKNNPSVIISTFSLIVALLALKVNRETAKLNSYNQKACYHVFVMKKGLIAHLLKKHIFNVKIFPSISSEVIPFDYRLYIQPYIGGIYRAQIFSTFDDEYVLGISKTGPTILTTKPKGFSLKKYANNLKYYLSSNLLFPYVYATSKFDENSQKSDNQLNRYHFYIEITDYCSNTEIWYMSFSLLLSNMNDPNYTWKKCTYYHGYDYFTFHDISIVSPNDIPKNFSRIENFNKSLDEIVGKEENTLDSVNLIEHGFEKLEYDLQLYEMKEYILLIKKLSNNKLT